MCQPASQPYMHAWLCSFKLEQVALKIEKSVAGTWCCHFFLIINVQANMHSTSAPAIHLPYLANDERVLEFICTRNYKMVNRFGF